MKKVIQQLKQGDIGVLPTDTIYEIHGRVFDERSQSPITFRYI